MQSKLANAALMLREFRSTYQRYLWTCGLRGPERHLVRDIALGVVGTDVEDLESAFLDEVVENA